MMEVVVLGGGVIGLTTALQLLRDPRIPSHLQVWEDILYFIFCR